MVLISNQRLQAAILFLRIDQLNFHVVILLPGIWGIPNSKGLILK